MVGMLVMRSKYGERSSGLTEGGGESSPLSGMLGAMLPNSMAPEEGPKSSSPLFLPIVFSSSIVSSAHSSATTAVARCCRPLKWALLAAAVHAADARRLYSSTRLYLTFFKQREKKSRVLLVGWKEEEKRRRRREKGKIYCFQFM